MGSWLSGRKHWIANPETLYRRGFRGSNPLLSAERNKMFTEITETVEQKKKIVLCDRCGEQNDQSVEPGLILNISVHLHKECKKFLELGMRSALGLILPDDGRH